MKQCKACGMPLQSAEVCAGKDLNADFCLYCVNETGEVKSCQEIFEGGINFFVGATGATKQEAEKLVRKNMKALPYWQDKNCDCFKGETATDEEFQKAMKKLAV